jgi:membrane protein DedA with SNARE-associated domain/rhodanese-related sulfurtransferase
VYAREPLGGQKILMNGTTELTYTSIGLAVFAQQFGLPVPAMLLLMAAGTLARQGELHLSLVLLSAVAGCVAADGAWFWLGRRWGSRVIRAVCSLTRDPQRSRERAHRIFARWGLRLLLIAKFLPVLDGLSPPLAGAEGASVKGFVGYDTAGSLLWTAGYALLGFMFAHQLDGVIHLIEHFGKMLALVLGVPLLLYVALRALYLWRVIRQLRLRRISPAMLQQKIDERGKMAIFDLLNYEARAEGVAGIPGAVRVDATRMRKGPRLAIPEGVSVVLYSSAKNEFASARVAEALRKRGIFEVWVLEGGLEAWVQEGRPVTTHFEKPEEVAARLGIVLPERA